MMSIASLQQWTNQEDVLQLFLAWGDWENWEIALIASAIGLVVGLLLRLKPSV